MASGHAKRTIPTSDEARAALRDLFDDFNLTRRGYEQRLSTEQMTTIWRAIFSLGGPTEPRYDMIRLLYLHDLLLVWDNAAEFFPQWPRCTRPQLARRFRVSVRTIDHWHHEAVRVLVETLGPMLQPYLSDPRKEQRLTSAWEER